MKAFLEAEAYDGPALIIAYSHCIAHGINMTTAMQNQKAAVNPASGCCIVTIPSGCALGENPLQLDSAAPRVKVADYFKLEQPVQDARKEPIRALRRELLAQAQARRERRGARSTNFSPPENSTHHIQTL